LIDQNSTFTVDPTDNKGATIWTLDNVNQLYTQQWFYRLTPGGPVNSINCLGTPIVTPDSNGQAVDIKYTPSGFSVTLAYTLYGGSPGSGSSDVSEVFRIQNNTSTALNFTLFEYSDFDLVPNRDDDRAAHINTNFVQQWDNTSQLVVSESVVRPPDRWYVGAGAYTITGDLPNSAASYGPADCAWAFQWDLLVPANGSIAFSKNKMFSTNIPEPMSVVLGVMGLMAVGGFRRFRK